MKKLQEENDQLKETLEKMKNTSVSDLNERERETKWKREIHQLTFDLQRVIVIVIFILQQREIYTNIISK